jgi:hypothetical protein
MNRALWTQDLTNTSCPPWPCPTCKDGRVILVPDSLENQLTATSRNELGNPDCDQEWVRLHFTAWGTCSNPKCNESFSIAGSGRLERNPDPIGTAHYDEVFIADHVRPTLCIIEIPKSCPPTVDLEIHAAFELFRSHPAACAGRIRAAIECLMDHLRVARKGKKENGKRFYLTLHARIELFSKKNPVVGQQLNALKWLGNTGSHDSTVTHDDLLDALEIMEHSLTEILEPKAVRIAELAKTLTKKHKRKKA